jgi:hypothetical protein
MKKTVTITVKVTFDSKDHLRDAEEIAAAVVHNLKFEDTIGNMEIEDATASITDWHDISADVEVK